MRVYVCISLSFCIRIRDVLGHIILLEIIAPGSFAEAEANIYITILTEDGNFPECKRTFEFGDGGGGVAERLPERVGGVQGSY